DGIGGDVGVQRVKDEQLAVAGDAPDGPSAVANIKALLVVKGNAGGNAHAFGISTHGAVGRYAVNSALIARRHVHLTLGVKGDAGGVHQVRKKRLDVVVGINFVD